MAENTVPAKTERTELETRDERTYMVPPCDIYETSDGLTVIVDLPGVEKDGVDIRVEDNVLTIQGRNNHETVQNGLLTEFRLQDFYRQFRLGEQVNQEKISADMKNGVLTIQLPKVEKAQPRQISVNVG